MSYSRTTLIECYSVLLRFIVMFRNATPQKAITFIQFCVALTCCWPLPSSATKSELFRFKILRSLMLLNAFMLLGPMLYAMHGYRDDVENMSKAVLLTISVVQVLAQTSSCIFQYDRYQQLIEEMTYCCEKACSYERHVFQRYVDKYSMFYGTSAVWIYATALLVIFGSLFLSDPFPTNARYPFAIDFEPVRSIIFLHQALVGIQCAAHVSISLFCAHLLLFSSARFEILQLELCSIKNAVSLIKCIKKYHSIRRYAAEVIYATRTIIVITVVLCAVVTVFSGILFIGRQPFTVRFQSICLASIALLKVFMCTLPADRLMDMSENVMRGAYESKWYRHPLRLQKYVLFTLVPQTPVILSVRFIIPTLSLSYYCSFISNVFSLFTVLRIVMTRNEDDY